MKPKIKRLLIAIGSLLLSTNAFAHDFEVDGIYYNILSSTDKTVSVTYRGSYYNSYNNEYTGSVTIPETVTSSGKTYSVTSIGDSAFDGCSGLTSVVIPNSVKSIGYRAFYYCSGLTGDLIIPNSVTSIQNYAFDGCSGLTSVNISDLSAWCKINFWDSYSNPLYYAHHLKLNGTEITNLVIPDEITEIKAYAFYYCGGLTSVTIPNSVTEIGSSAFRGTGWYNNQSDGVLYLDNCCLGYKGEKPIGELSIREGTRLIADNAFYGCSGLTGDLVIPNSVTSIGSSAFYGCSGLTGDLVIPNSVTSIGSSAFSGCSGLTSVAIPNSVTYIYSSAFEDCSGLKSVTIGNSVTSIGVSAFAGCKNITELIIADGVEPISIRDSFSDCPFVKLYIGRNFSYNTTNSPFSNRTTLKEITIGNSVTSIGSSAFCDCDGLTSVTIGTGVLSIGTHAFSYKSGSSYYNLAIKKVIWLTNTPPEGYKNVGSRAHYVANNLYNELSNVTVYPYLSSLFEVDGIKYVPVSPSERTCDAIDCSYDTSISNIIIGNTVSFKGIEMKLKAVKPYTFYNNTNLATVTIDSEFNGPIDDYAFAYCNKLDGIILPNGVTSLGGSAFEGCSSLATVEIGAGIPALKEKTFYGCSSLASVGIGSGIATLKEKTFYGCSSLPTITIPANVTSIGNYVFDNCTSLEELTIFDRETELSLGSNGSNPLFSDCPLKSVYIGGNISYPTSSDYGYSPFYRNTSLETVVITDKETEISENEFYGCTALKSVSMGDGVETIGNWAFSGCSSLDFFSFGSGMKTIGTEAFSDCNAMTKLYSKAIVPPTCGSQALDDINKWNCELYVPQASITKYQIADQWKEFFFIKDIESGVEEVLVDGEDYLNAPIEIFNLSGLKVGDSTENLAPGVYIKRQGRKVEKIVIQ